MEYADIFVPIIVGLIAFLLYLFGLKIYDWIHLQLVKISLIKSISKRESDNKTRIMRIENNLVIQDSINDQIIKFIAEKSDEELEVLLNKYDAEHIKTIKSRNTTLSDGQASTGLNKCKGSKNHFHLIPDKP